MAKSNLNDKQMWRIYTGKNSLSNVEQIYKTWTKAEGRCPV